MVPQILSNLMAIPESRDGFFSERRIEPMREASLDFLKSLIAAPSPSGYEQPAARVWRDYVAPYAERIEHDLHGNSMAFRAGQGGPRLMFAGHCDELGFMVYNVDEKGFIYIRTIGGHDISLIPGRRVILLGTNGPVPGVTGKKAIHLMDAEERKTVPKLEQIWIDIGSASREETLEKIAIGDPIIYDTGYQQLTDDLATSRAFDDKVGAFAVAEALRLLQGKKLTAEVVSVATVQEEIGLRGAHTSTYSVDPTVGIAVDVTHATDYPQLSNTKYGDTRLGGGPVILRGANANPIVVQRLMEAARAEDIPFQVLAFPRGTGTDANAIQLTRGGVATGLIGIPLRYMHTPSEVVSLADVENTARLLAAFAERVEKDADFRPQ